MMTRTVFGAIVFILASASAANGPAISVVYPTGAFPDDVKNVQVAIHKGGIVFLKAFNTSRSVSFAVKIQIVLGV
jgi:hypothetical protein